MATIIAIYTLFSPGCSNQSKKMVISLNDGDTGVRGKKRPLIAYKVCFMYFIVVLSQSLAMNAST